MSLAHALHTYPLNGIDSLASPKAGLKASMRTPALDILNDYMRYRPLLVEGTSPVSSCEELMRRSHIKLMLVVDKNDHLLGIVDLVDLVGPAVQKLLTPDCHKEDIAVATVMTPRAELKSIALADLTHATVADLVETLKHEHCAHVLVVDREAGQVRGVISASDIAHCLNMPLDITYSPNFADICHVTREHLANTT